MSLSSTRRFCWLSSGVPTRFMNARQRGAHVQAIPLLTTEFVLLELLDNVTDALTYDRHFEQAGFRALLWRTLPFCE